MTERIPLPLLPIRPRNRRAQAEALAERMASGLTLEDVVAEDLSTYSNPSAVDDPVFRRFRRNIAAAYDQKEIESLVRRSLKRVQRPF